LFDEYFSHIKEDDDTVPYKHGDYLYFTREEKGVSYKKHYRKKDSPDAAEELILDVNEIAAGLSYCSVSIEPSPDNKTLCYLVDTKGNYASKAYFKNLIDGSLFEEVLENVGQIIWSNDSKSIYYCLYENNSFGKKVYLHIMGTKQQGDLLLKEEKDERYFYYLYTSKSKRFIVFDSGGISSSECYYLDQTDMAAGFKLFSKRQENFRYNIDHNDEKFYILTNKDAADYRIMTTPIGKTSVDNWEEFIGETKGVKIEGFDVFKNHLVVNERSNALTNFRVVKLADKSFKYVDFPEPAYCAFPVNNIEFESSSFRYEYMSFVTPRSVIDYDMNSGENILLKEKETPAYDKSNYISERHNVPSHDGRIIPLSLVYKKGIKRNGKNPILIHSYGSYGVSSEVYFSPIRLSLLERGFIFAVAHVRGGGELGEKWYEDGKLLNKKNTFLDFISCCEYLINEGYTYSGGISAVGASAGGTLMGAIANMRPELFKCIQAIVPYVDVLSTFFAPEVQNAAYHYDENGNPAIEEHYYYMKSYSPYENLKPQSYPNMLLTAGYNDVQVHYWEPAKFLAKLRELNTGTNLQILKTRMDSAHFGSSGKYDLYREIAFDDAFMLKCYGIDK
jgi:oligopeptidase B